VQNAPSASLFFCLRFDTQPSLIAFALRMDADDLIDRNRRLLTIAEATRVLTRLLVEEVAENRLRLHVTLLHTVHLHYGRTGFLSEMVYLRQSIAHEVITHHVTWP
jgi:hypothetical protein